MADQNPAKKKPAWTKSKLAPLALAPALFVVGLIIWPVGYGRLFDIFLLTFGLSVGIILCKRVELWLLGFLVIGITVFDVPAYTVSHPLSEPIWEPIRAYLGSASLRSLDWVLRTFALAFVLTGFIATVKGRNVLSGFLLGLTACVLLGSGPAILKRDTLHFSIQRMEKFDQPAIERLMATQSSRVLEVEVVSNESRAYPAIMARTDQIIITQFLSEATDNGFKFWFKNGCAWRWKDLDGNPVRMEGTFESPCVLKSGVMTSTSPSDYPLPPQDWDSLSVSVNAIHVGGGLFAPVINKIEVYVAQRDGEITMVYNLPRGRNSHVKAGSYGRRLFRVWAVDQSLYLKAKAQIAAL